MLSATPFCKRGIKARHIERCFEKAVKIPLLEKGVRRIWRGVFCFLDLKD
jgi:hypothetical protein